MINNKTILLFGGTGSLGYEFVKRYINNNIIYAYSRDECKHWKMKLDFNNNKNLHFIIGDIINKNKVKLKSKLKMVIIRMNSINLNREDSPHPNLKLENLRLNPKSPC